MHLQIYNFVLLGAGLRQHGIPAVLAAAVAQLVGRDGPPVQLLHRVALQLDLLSAGLGSALVLVIVVLFRHPLTIYNV